MRDAGRPGGPLRIGVLAPPWIAVPPPAYGGIEHVVHLQVRALTRAGHEVTLVAAPGSSVPGVRVVTPLARAPHTIGLAAEEWRHALAGVEALRDHDVILDHSGPLGALIAATSGVPCLHVVHGTVDGPHGEPYRRAAALAPGLRLVAISAAQRDLAPDLPWAAVCPNGLDVAAVPFTPRADDPPYAAFLGRVCPTKGVARAIEVARRAGVELRIAAKCREPDEHAHFEEAVRPFLGRGVRWLGEVGTHEKWRLLGGASALLFPIAWEEPFGMVMIEAMACGTPVVATPRGAVPEVVEDGVTGFVAADDDALVAALRDAERLDRAGCRAAVRERFSPAALGASYERALRAALAATPGAPAVTRAA